METRLSTLITAACIMAQLTGCKTTQTVSHYTPPPKSPYFNTISNGTIYSCEEGVCYTATELKTRAYYGWGDSLYKKMITDEISVHSPLANEAGAPYIMLKGKK